MGTSFVAAASERVASTRLLTCELGGAEACVMAIKSC